MTLKRTHHCAQLTKADIGAAVRLSGWVDSIRDHGGILFVDLRDRKGVTQVKFDPRADADLGARAAHLRPESVASIAGRVVARPAGTVNAGMPTGEVEVDAAELEILNASETPPFPLDDAGGDKVNEDLRLTYRYLDLRRPRMRHNLAVRHRATKSIRDYFDAQDFIEVETPILFKSTPEGAREYLVPSRIHAGEFYALSQSPQQFKQILMVAGVERYFQIARCFRDEDLRADRQMEFTQVDVEASFVDREDIYALFEGMLKKLWKDVLGTDIPTPFPRMPYVEAMNRFGVDKPDMRFGFELMDFSEAFRASSFKVFQSAVASGGAVKALNAKGLADLTQGELKALEEVAKSVGARGLAFIKVEAGEWKSPIVKFFSDAEKAALTASLGIAEGEGLRDPRQDKARGRGASAEARQARDQGRRLEVPLGRRFPPHELRRAGEALRRDAPPVHGAGARGRGPPRFQPQGGPRAALRRRPEWDGARGRLDPDPPARPPEKGV